MEIWGRIHFFFLSYLVTFKKRINKSSSSSNILGKPGSHTADMPQKRLRQYKFSFHKCTTHLCSYIMATQLTKRTPRNMKYSYVVPLKSALHTKPLASCSTETSLEQVWYGTWDSGLLTSSQARLGMLLCPANLELQGPSEQRMVM